MRDDPTRSWPDPALKVECDLGRDRSEEANGQSQRHDSGPRGKLPTHEPPQGDELAIQLYPNALLICKNLCKNCSDAPERLEPRKSRMIP